MAKDPQVHLTLEEAVMTALSKNLSLQIKKTEKEIARQELGVSRSFFLPQADFRLRSSYINTIDTFTPISIQVLNPDGTVSTVTAENVPPKYETDISFVARQNLFKGFGDYGNYRMNRSRYQATEYDQKAMEQDVIYRVMKSYWGLQLFQDQLQSELLKNSTRRQSYNISKVKWLWGSLSKMNYEENEAQSYENARLLEMAKNQYESSKAIFFNLLGTRDMAKTDIVLVSDPIEALKKFKWEDDGSAVTSIQSDNNEIKKLEKEVEASKYKKIAAKSDLYPSLDVSFQHDFVGRSQKDFNGSFDDLKRDRWMVIGTVQLKLLDGFKTWHEVKKADAEYRLSQLRLEEARNADVQEFETKRPELRQMDAEIDLAGKRLEIESMRNQANEINYQQGDISKNEFERASFSRLEAKYEYRKKVINKLLRILELNKIKGKSLLEGIHDNSIK